MIAVVKNCHSLVICRMLCTIWSVFCLQIYVIGTLVLRCRCKNQNTEHQPNAPKTIWYPTPEQMFLTAMKLCPSHHPTNIFPQNNLLPLGDRGIISLFSPDTVVSPVLGHKGCRDLDWRLLWQIRLIADPMRALNIWTLFWGPSDHALGYFCRYRNWTLPHTLM